MRASPRESRYRSFSSPTVVKTSSREKTWIVLCSESSTSPLRVEDRNRDRHGARQQRFGILARNNGDRKRLGSRLFVEGDAAPLRQGVGSVRETHAPGLGCLHPDLDRAPVGVEEAELVGDALVDGTVLLQESLQAVQRHVHLEFRGLRIHVEVAEPVVRTTGQQTGPKSHKQVDFFHIVRVGSMIRFIVF